jgi:KaiC/GvpD/RAD55 family RecA-like ATPase
MRDINQLINFTLTPVLGTSVTLLGSVRIQIYVRGETSASGTARVLIAERRQDGSSREILEIQNPQSIDTRILSLPFIFGRVNATLNQGSTLILGVEFLTANERAKPRLVFDDPRFPTHVAIPVVTPIDIRLEISDPDRKTQQPIFSTNDTIRGRVPLFASLNITDPLGLYRIASTSLNITETRTERSISLDQMRQVTLSQYSVLLSQNFTMTQGSYEATASILDVSQNRHEARSRFWVTPFFELRLRVVDASERPVEDAVVDIQLPFASYHNTTGGDGLAEYLVPSSEIVGPFNVAVVWKGLTIQLTSGLQVLAPTTLSLIFPIYDYSLTIRLLFIPLPSSWVELIRDDDLVAGNWTTTQGTVRFERIPQGVYMVRVHYLWTSHDTTVLVDSTKSELFVVPLPYSDEISSVVILAFAVGVATAVVRRRTKLYPVPFEHFRTITNGGLPGACVATIVGNSGSGKSVLAQTLANESLEEGRSCVFVVNTEFPENVRDSMKRLGIQFEKHESEGQLAFIDSYSGFSGEASKEKRHVSSATDLTGLGIRISVCLDEMTGPTDVYLDSLTPLLSTLKDDYVLAFIQSLGAKTKANGGRFISTLGTGLERVSITRMVEASDCVVEMQVLDTRSGQQRRLRIKKLRGKGYSDKWVRFRVIPEKGIIFYSPKAYAEPAR